MEIAPILALKLLLLIGAANGAPIVGRRLLGDRYGMPVDGGCTLGFDGQALFGASKTIRGVLLSVLTTTALAPMLGLALKVGLAIGLFAMAGDLLTSFVKRRLGMPPSAMAPPLDQAPEALLPLLAIRAELGLSGSDVVVLTAAFVVLGLLLSRVLFQLNIREHPY